MKNLLLFLLFAAWAGIHSHQLRSETIEVDGGIRYQTIRGIGSSTRVADSYMKQSSHQDYYLNTLGASAYRAWLPYDLIGNTGLASIKYSNFSDAKAMAALEIPIELKKKHPSLWLIGTFWTPPGWMKVSGKDNGTDGANSAVNVLREDREDHFARYVLEVAKMMKEKYQAPLDAISFQNEPRFDTFYGSCVYSSAQYARVFRKIVDEFRAADFPMQFFGPEHMTNDWPNSRGMVLELLNDPEYGPAMPFLAAHGYTDGVQYDQNPASATSFWEKITDPYEREFWMTETSGEPHTWEGALDGVGGQMHNAFVHGHASLFTYWLINHESAYHAEELFEAGVPQKKAYVFQHFSKYLRPGMVRVDASTHSSIDCSAWIDALTGEMVLILLNRKTTSQSAEIRLLHQPGINDFSRWTTTASANQNFQAGAKLSVLSNDTMLINLDPRSITTLRGTGGSFVSPQFTFQPGTNPECPPWSSQHDLTVECSNPLQNWSARSKTSWIKILVGAAATGKGILTLQVSRNTSTVPRQGTMVVAGQKVTIRQLGKGVAESIFQENEITTDFGWGNRYNGLGFFHDLHYPFVYLWKIGSWVYVWPDGASERNGFFFYRFDQNHWGWSGADYYPLYVGFSDGEKWTEF